ncbi:transposase domain-containing protein [Neomegalonema sp.]|uniref:transposase domain-containing protein n=1 Tax=Neomegalonema sp. TaxID=2039713 RepID=UPI00262785D6|nr:transposase domain-containing protein [Neomegalonema sp.]MDD2870113.1 transposase domain-containing protein [Neomegalonema sp.]
MIEWMSAADWAAQGLPGLPSTARRIADRANRDQWQSRPREGRGGGLEYHWSSLPEGARAAWLLRHGVAPAAAPKSEPEPLAEEPPQEEAWTAYQAAPDHLRQEAERRMKLILDVLTLIEAGSGRVSAVELIAEKSGTAPATLRRWIAAVKRVEQRNWLPALAPRYAGKAERRAECDESAWDWYAGHYLTRRQPSHADSYRRLEEVAANEGWRIPSAKTLARRIETEIDPLVIVMRREGVKAVAARLPKQRRDVSVFAPGEAVNGDGLKFDKLWVRFPDGEILNTATAWFFQDLPTRRILAFRLGKTEHTDLFRLATYDLTAICAPRLMWIDNTRVAANKLMTAGVEHRHRFRKDESDGVGLLPALGIEPHFTNPDGEIGNPGAKPIERAFGIGGLHDKVATHPALAGRGYSKATAVPVEEVQAILVDEVRRHNAQPKRRTQLCRGLLSFDEAWAEAEASGLILRRFSEAQRRLLLMAREAVTVGRDGVVSVKAGSAAWRKNRYWAEATARLAGQKVVALFDPENLSAGIHVYALDGRYLAEATYMPDEAFNSTDAGREWSKNRRRQIKTVKQGAAAAERMREIERAELYAKARRAAQENPEAPPEAATGAVVAGYFARTPDPARDAREALGSPESGAAQPLDFAAMAAARRAARNAPQEREEDEEEGGDEFVQQVLAGARAFRGLPPAE